MPPTAVVPPDDPALVPPLDPFEPVVVVELPPEPFVPPVPVEPVGCGWSSGRSRSVIPVIVSFNCPGRGATKLVTGSTRLEIGLGKMSSTPGKLGTGLLRRPVTGSRREDVGSGRGGSRS